MLILPCSKRRKRSNNPTKRMKVEMTTSRKKRELRESKGEEILQ